MRSMLWSIIPEALVLAGVDENFSLLEGTVAGRPCRLRRQSDGSASIEALCSTDPKDFLRAELAPGRRIFLPK